MNILKKIRSAGEHGNLFEVTIANIEAWINSNFLPDWALASIEELVEKEAWNELNNRFYKYLEFGTGGMRGRTIGEFITKAERGIPLEFEAPQHPAVGAATLNDFNIIRATIGLFHYCEQYLQIKSPNDTAAKIVIAHDVRFFSKHLSDLVASTWVQLGGHAEIFSGPRSTPQLSFSVRYLGSTCGVVITASHNPPHDNGFKIYFDDGAQVVAPHDVGIIKCVDEVKLADVSTYLNKELDGVVTLPLSLDQAYLDGLEENILDPGLFKKNKLRIVFTPIHGTGGIISLPLMERFGIEVIPVEQQMKMDPRFPTVKSPNPENAEALSAAIALAKNIKADLLFGTDPDSDRMGVGVADEDGEMKLLSGNIIGALLADYRITKLKELGVVPKNGSQNAAIIKTFVTTPFQESIADIHGIKVINTLTGFKWIGEKLKIYEEQLRKNLLQTENISLNYDATSYRKRAELLLRYSTFTIFGGEESYGYLGTDRVRDKDANAAIVIFCELAAALKSKGKDFIEHLDELYLKYGYFLEDLLNIYYEGASGAVRIKSILNSYRSHSPTEMGEYKVTKFTDFGKQTLYDADGKEIPKQDFYMLELDNGYSYAVRGSGTEPKIKFYLFAQEEVSEPSELDTVKRKTATTLKSLIQAIEDDAHRRAG